MAEHVKKYKTLSGIDNTICGSELTAPDTTSLRRSGIIKDTEEVARLWAHRGWRGGLDISGALVGLSDIAVFKYENFKVTARVLFSDITIASHISENVLRWDAINLSLRNGTTEKIRIYHASACKHFVNHINQMVHKSLK